MISLINATSTYIYNSSSSVVSVNTTYSVPFFDWVVIAGAIIFGIYCGLKFFKFIRK